MNKVSLNIMRVVVSCLYILLIGFITYGISSIYSYLNTGADRSKMLNTEVKQVEQYLPKVTWKPFNNEGRSIDEQTLSAIENDYLDSWYIKHNSYRTNTSVGVEDYYTESSRKNIYNIIEENTKNNISINGTTLRHQPDLKFFSEDGQMVVLTDNDVIEYKRIFKGDTLIGEVKDKADYTVTMLLEDGFWRVRHLVKTEYQSILTDSIINTPLKFNIKGINYYPQATAWDMYGANFDSSIIANDLEIIKKAGLNSIRIFIPYENFGKAKVDTNKLNQVLTILDIAESQQLKVLVTLFDFYGDYSVLDWTLNQRHAESIVNALKNHDALLGWDVKNEPNLDFESRGRSLVTAWLKQMIVHIKNLDPEHPVTIGWSNAESAHILKEELDFVSFHYYESLEDLETTYKDLQLKIPNKPIVITEYGLSSYNGFWKPFGPSQEDQATYHETIQNTFSKHNIPFMSWTLYDFSKIPKEVVGRLPWRKNIQKHFGFIDKDGQKKASFKFISSKE